MSKQSWDTIRQKVSERAGGCCEYCQTCADNTGRTMQVDHINPIGGDSLANLALACWNCNNHKRQAIDPETEQLADLYHPRKDDWDEHFEWQDNYVRIHGLTPSGRATVIRLKMNRPIIQHARKRWVEFGYHPPSSS